MQEICTQYEELKRFASEHAQANAFVHHYQIMDQLRKTGFVPNPEPKIIVAEVADPRRIYAYKS